MTQRSAYGPRARSALLAGLVLPLALSGSTGAAAPMARSGERASLAASFESVTLAAEAVAVEPSSWFPVRGTIDFGGPDASFGAPRPGHMHEGQDIFAAEGTPVVSVREGRVVDKGHDGGRGNYVGVWGPAVRRTFVYLHLEKPSPLAVGEEVGAGSRVGAVGCTGSCWGDHLHFEMRHGRGTTGEPLDPLPLLRRLVRRAR